ncbi:phosphotransferase [Paenibacillus jamilae]|uniref:Phosphotransferase n=2 Tax=Paenibacillus TaxID=44249 RepID=A0ACC4ZNV6_9BACL|nr:MULTISPECIES: pyruvate, water dikinase regulatory protein [Paenibacillus]MCV9952602.1 kinase/pyrophosphorylase [Paenibacillus sp. BT-177]ADO56390.1 phosphotransferase [Paenibacillus polymyxa SC2]AJE49716.1 phosphotransferase [Paenibacillus polymyxa]AUO08963.1 kinase/pyrophosphorylase [Paenibacillus sp. lzh-N1]AZH29355.1 kinase/pyrophosphorylase [Paenibacillus sp. M-152]
MVQASSHFIAICSDSIGETAEAVVQATMRQFELPDTEIKRFMNVRDEDELSRVMEEVAERKGFVAYTLVQPELREAMKEEAVRLNVRAVDIMGPMMQAFADTFHNDPKEKPGLLHRLDDNYFRRVEALDFAVQYDDGKDVSAILKADIVLLGVSRISKTPLSMFLAHKGYKTVNIPVVPELTPPVQLKDVQRGRVFGLTIQPELLLKIRSERLKVMGLPNNVQYATATRVEEEIAYAQSLFKELNCPVIDVTDKAIEETAGLIVRML